jgi:rSAM/selenodomain-associated transferase 1
VISKNKNCLIIFTRNPELGKGKRRLAATVGDQAALDIYCFLLNHTRSITMDLKVNKQVWYSEKVHENDSWNKTVYQKQVQNGKDLGMRMKHAFNTAFQNHNLVIIIGSDMYDMLQVDIEEAFYQLEKHDAVIGPAEDGGYYLIGFKKRLVGGIFDNKEWGTPSVLKDTLADLVNVNYALLKERNDVDVYEDIKDIPVFQPFLKHLKNAQ